MEQICSIDSNFAIVHNFDHTYIQEENIEISPYAASVYDDNWWIGIFLEKNEVECDVTMKFMHPKGPSNIFLWLQRDDNLFYSKSLYSKSH